MTVTVTNTGGERARTRTSDRSTEAQKAGVLSRASEGVGVDGETEWGGCSDFDEAQTKLPPGGSNKPSGGLGAVEPARTILYWNDHGDGDGSY